MIYRLLNLLALLFFFYSCKNTETFEDKLDTEIILAFNNVNKVSIKRDIGYLPRWQDRIEFEGSFYIPLNTDKTLSSFTSDSVKYSLDDKIWLKANKRGDNWKFKILTILPNDVDDSRQSGIIMYEDWKDGKLSYDGYIENKLLSATNYEKKIRFSSSLQKVAGVGPIMNCRMVTSEVCAGSGDYEYCKTRHQMLCGRSDFDNEGGGGGSGSGGLGGGGGSDSGGSGGNGNVPPIIPPMIGSKVAVRKFNDAIDDTNLPDCMKEVLAALKNLNGNTVADIIKKFAGEVPGYNLKFVTENFSDHMQVAGTNRNSSTGEMIIGFNVNPTVIGNVTDLALGTTMLHESIHAYLTAFYYNDPTAAKLSYPELFVKYSKQKAFSNGIQHEIFAKNFINDIAASIKNYGEMKGYDLDKQVYDDIAWKGLVETEAFKSLSETDRDRIIDRIMAEQYDTRKEKNVKQEGTRLGC